MNIETPKGWRKGQTIFNFLQWLCRQKNVSGSGDSRMADPFHIGDEDWDRWYEEFLALNNP